jgi:PadR family transcriptional regulator, regulatory protein AphA
MSLKHAVLGFLTLSPLSGYDLKKAFDNSVQHFWPADQSQIYRTLAQLVAAGWAQVEPIPQTDRPDRKVYHVTEAGRTELRRWLITPLPSRTTRDVLLVQLFFASIVADHEVLALLEQEAAQAREQLAGYRQMAQAYMPADIADQIPRELFFELLTLDYGITMAQCHLDWIEGVMAYLRGEPWAFTSMARLRPNNA